MPCDCPGGQDQDGVIDGWTMIDMIWADIVTHPSPTRPVWPEAEGLLRLKSAMTSSDTTK